MKACSWERRNQAGRIPQKACAWLKRRLFLGQAVFWLLLVGTPSAQAGLESTCGDVQYNCTANDIGVTSISLIKLVEGCTSSTGTAKGEITVAIKAGNAARYRIGLWLGKDGMVQDGSKYILPVGGACFREALFPVGSPVNSTSGTGPFLNLDTQPCGDVDKNDSYLRTLVDGDVSSGSTTAAQVSFKCQDLDGNGYVDIPWMLTWDNNKDNSTTCSVNDTVPPTTSKCNVGYTDTLSIGNPVGIPNLSWTISCTPTTVNVGQATTCTATYENAGNGPADWMEFYIDYPESLGAVSAISPGIGSASDNGNAILWQPMPLASRNIPTSPTVGYQGTITFNFTPSTSLSTLDFSIQGRFNNTADGFTPVLVGDPATTQVQVTAALVTAFEAAVEEGLTTVRWETTVETNTAGFHLERLDPLSGEFHPVHKALLPASLGRASLGASYRFVDEEAPVSGQVTYRLVEIETDGDALIHGPYERTIRQATSHDGASHRATAPAFFPHDFTRAEHGPSLAQKEAWAAKRERRLLDRQSAKQRRGPRATALKVELQEAGLYYLSAAVLAGQFGESEQTVARAIAKGTLALKHRGASIGYLPSPSGTGLYFYAEPFSGIYTREDVYWVSLDGTKGDGHMGTIASGPIGLIGAGQHFVSETRLEEDIWLVPGALNDPEADIWFAGFVSTGYWGNTAYQSTIKAPGAAIEGEAKLRVWMRGLTDLAPGHDHHAQFFLNGLKIGDAVWNGMDAKLAEATFTAASVLRDGENALKVNGLLEPGVKQSSFVVEKVELAYERRYEAVDDALRFRGEEHATVAVQGFSGSDIVVLDISHPKRPLKISKVELIDAGTSVGVKIAPATANTEYLATRLSSALKPSAIYPDNPSDLKNPAMGADYLIIAPASLSSGAEALASYRRTVFDTLVVDLQDIYDEFNHGIPDAHAIRDFLIYANNHWEKAPIFTVLAGRGTLDPKDIEGFGTNVLPVLLSATPYGLFPSDVRYADIIGNDGLADISLSRIPALDSEQLTGYVEKLMAYEAEGDANWKGRAILLNDDPDKAGDFAADSDKIQRLLATQMTINRIAHVRGGKTANTRAALLAAIRAGAGLLNYVGHGGPTQFGTEGFLSVTDASALANSPLFPIMGAFTCYVGNDTLPGLDSLAGELLLEPNAGVVSAFAPIGVSINDQAAVLNEAFVEALAQNQLSVGEAALDAYAALNQQPHGRFMLETYNLFGCPAIRLH